MKRFYKAATVEAADGGWRVLLDGRGIKTAAGKQQIVPTAALAEAMATEWEAQGETIDVATLIMRSLADYAIDIVAPDRETAVRKLMPFAETDTLCYRAEAGEALHVRQLEVWEPLLVGAEARWDVHFERISGIIHRPQPTGTLCQMAATLAAQDDFALAALTQLASLSSSMVIALTALAPDADGETLWRAANLEEDWQAELWGKDAEAEARKSCRKGEFLTAMRFAALAEG